MSGTAARSCSWAVLQAFARQPLSALAAAMGVDESVACRIRAGESRATVAQFGAALDACGLRIVPADRVCVSEERLTAVTSLLAAAMNDPAAVRRLVQEDEA